MAGMKLADVPVSIDFETEPIENGRPVYPPEPVACSVKMPGKRPEFFAGKKAMLAGLRKVWMDARQPMLFHNAPFDVSVAVERLGLPLPHWKRLHDTMFLLFLQDPYAPDLQLKPAAERILGTPQDDQDELRDWIHENVPEAKRAKTKWGKYISRAPMELIKKRAGGDVDRTEGLYRKVLPEIEARGMRAAYDRERRILPMMLRNSRDGVRVDAKAVYRDCEEMEHALVKADVLIRKYLKAPGLNPGSPKELVKAIDARGMGGNWLLTASGQPSAAKNSLLQGVTDKKLLALLQYRGKVDTALTTFLRNWCATLDMTGDKLHTDWNQVRGEGRGARTGRFASTPNFQNIPKYLKTDDMEDLGLPLPPKLRKYFIPDAGEIWVRRDFSQQELRILAHMSGGELADLYLANPKADLHQYAADAMKHLDLMRADVQVKVNRYDDARGIAKMIAFSLLYGMGLDELAYRLGITRAEAQKVRSAYLDLWPGLRQMQKDIKDRARAGLSIRTWGGREYYCEPPRVIEGRLRTFDYKLLNYLIQGSAADCTKEALARLDEAGLPGRFLLSVHDEISWSLPKRIAAGTAKEIGRIMCSVEFDVPMLSDAEVGKGWGDLTKQPTW